MSKFTIIHSILFVSISLPVFMGGNSQVIAQQTTKRSVNGSGTQTTTRTGVNGNTATTNRSVDGSGNQTTTRTGVNGNTTTTNRSVNGSGTQTTTRTGVNGKTGTTTRTVK